jgi:MoaA/NifB/PqqE/SkfB family radical SAM enzyme
MFKVEGKWGHQDSIKIEWNIGKRCNYDCSYCPAVIHDNHSPHTDISILKETVNKLKQLKKPIRLSLTGGEPCVHPYIEEFLFYIKEQDFWLNVTTNGTRKEKWYTQMPVDQYVFSLHFEYDWEDILDKIINLKMYSNTNMLVNVMAHHKKMKHVREAVDVLESYGIPFGIRRIRWTEGDSDLFDDMKYDQNDLDWILSFNSTVKPNTKIYYHREKDGDYIEELHANDIIKLHKNKFKDWTCNAGIESLMINWDGDVHRATCRVGGSLGNIYNNTFTIPTSPIICDRNFCTCAADIPLTKFFKSIE